MKIKNKLWAIFLTVLLFLTVRPYMSFAQTDFSISYQTFYDDLQPYGTWIYDPYYGNVWVPDAGEDFRPYATSGHWVITPYGNTWVSNYPWGWAPFHYGRWRYDDYYGWEWIPGYEWGPAWVNWRHGGGYYAWAPLEPGISIDLSFGSGYREPNDYWVCVPQAYVCDPYVNRYYVPHTRVVNIINNTTIINNTYVHNNNRYISGPRFQDVQRVSNRPVRMYNINNSTDPRHAGINNHTVNMYRPNVTKSFNNGHTPRPATVVDARAYKNAHPDAGLAHRTTLGAATRHDNAARLATEARNPGPHNSNVVRVNRPNAENNATRNRLPANIARPDRRSPANNNTGRNENNPIVQPQMRQRQQYEQQRQQQVQQQRPQYEQQRQQQRQQYEQPRQQQAQQQRQQYEQQRQQQAQQQRQQYEQQRQQQAQQQRQQYEQQRQQQPQQERQPQQEQQRRNDEQQRPHR